MLRAFVRSEGPSLQTGRGYNETHVVTVDGAISPEQAESTARQLVAIRNPGLVVTSVRARPVPESNTAWDVEVTVAPRAVVRPARHVRAPAFEQEFGFTTQSEHIVRSVAVVDSFVAPGEKKPADIENLIGDDGETVKGVDILAAISEWSIRSQIPVEEVDEDYRRKLATDLVGHVNSRRYRGYAPRELLLVGARITAPGDPKAMADVSYQFQIRYTRRNVQIGKITIDVLRGWDYLDVRYKRTKDPNTKRIVRTPWLAIVHQVYDAADFGALKY